MMFCDQCGQENKNEAKYCKHCGQPLQMAPITRSQPAPTMEPHEDLEEKYEGLKGKKEHGKKLIILGLLMMVMLGSAFGLWKYVAHEYDPMVFLQKVEEALLEGDEIYIRQVLQESTDGERLSQEDLQAIMELLLETAKREEVLASLHGQITGRKDETAEDAPPFFVIKEDERKAFFFSTYKLLAVPYYMDLESTFEEVVVHIDGTVQVPLTKDGLKQTFGPFYLGAHEVTVSYDLSGSLVKKEDTVVLFDVPMASVFMPLEVRSMKVHADYPTKLYINGQETDILVQGTYEVGPFPMDQNIEISGTMAFPWGTVEVPPVLTKGEEEITLTYEIVNDQFQESVCLSLVEFHEEYEEALRTKNPYGMTLGGGVVEFDLELILGFYGIANYESTLISLEVDAQNMRAEPFGDGAFIATAIGKVVKSFALKAPEILEGNLAPEIYEGAEYEETYYRYDLLFDEELKRWVVDLFRQVDPMRMEEPFIHGY